MCTPQSDLVDYIFYLLNKLSKFTQRNE